MAPRRVAPRDRGDKVWKEVKAVEPERLVEMCSADGIVESEFPSRVATERTQRSKKGRSMSARTVRSRERKRLSPRFILSSARACIVEAVSAS
jgi:hypothetical protein